jgi:hypothetical protein
VSTLCRFSNVSQSWEFQASSKVCISSMFFCSGVIEFPRGRVSVARLGVGGLRAEPRLPGRDRGQGTHRDWSRGSRVPTK